ncbi:hypothetical protein T05_1073 [Trichinella murrelli]|uniref:Uncharacterized protein n=1 Tax=Trichinella murrelli TaxID=144512 RepID=A0A0V0UC13_9BILA|nr:hypothetical protein T05_1073 [Trichinella murrelli]
MSTNLSVVIAVALVYTIATLWSMESTIVVVEGQLALVLGHALTTVGRDEGKLWKHLLLVDGRKGKIDLSFACCLVYFLKKRYSCCRQPFNREALLARFRHMLINQIHDC